jgi:hypothetical protein
VVSGPCSASRSAGANLEAGGVRGLPIGIREAEHGPDDHRRRADRDIADRDIADRDIADRDIADRDIADRDIADRDIGIGNTGVMDVAVIRSHRPH